NGTGVRDNDDTPLEDGERSGHEVPAGYRNGHAADFGLRSLPGTRHGHDNPDAPCRSANPRGSNRSRLVTVRSKLARRSLNRDAAKRNVQGETRSNPNSRESRDHVFEESLDGQSGSSSGSVSRTIGPHRRTRAATDCRIESDRKQISRVRASGVGNDDGAAM